MQAVQAALGEAEPPQGSRGRRPLPRSRHRRRAGRLTGHEVPVPGSCHPRAQRGV
jgi:hypothetical protein